MMPSDTLNRIILSLSFESLSMQREVRSRLSDTDNPEEVLQHYQGLVKKYAEKIQDVQTYCTSHHVHIISILDENYPPLLKQLHDCPLILYGKGRVESLKKTNHLAIVGTRKATQYGRLTAQRFARELGEYGITVVSGLAHGIDTAAHKGALESGDTIAVIGSGIDIQYPAANKRLYEQIYVQGLVITEFPPFFEPYPASFPVRNRIIAGLSRGVIIIESAERGGALITADHALHSNREVFAVPGRITDEYSAGTNQLIQRGAKLVLGVQDVIDELNWLIPKQAVNQGMRLKINPTEKKVYDILSIEPLHVDTIVEKTELPLSKVVSILSFLEIQNAAKQLPGKMYVRL